MLPGKDGFALMEDFQRAQIPVIYLTAKADVDSKVFGLRSGAEDYIVKPFEILELLARIEKVLERTGRGQSRLYIKDVVIDRERHCVYKKGKPVSLKPMEYEEYKDMKSTEIAAEVQHRIEEVIAANSKEN